MFSGIVEESAPVTRTEKAAGGLKLFISPSFISEIKEGQSISHNGACLTVERVIPPSYSVIAVRETLRRTNLGLLKPGSKINLERSMKIGDRLDGHFVQGHVDCMVTCTEIFKQKDDLIFAFTTQEPLGSLVVKKGSISVNGVSLTVVNCHKKDFTVAIIPYTFEHTNFCDIKKGTMVNIEFDVLGKYIAAILKKNKD